MATVPTSLPQRLVLVGESWQTYLRLLRVFEERPHLRLTYDRGALEIMTLSPRHENIRCLFDPLVRTAVEELGLALASYGSTTLKRQRQRRGLEPDQCYWIANEALVRGKTRFDFRVDPPADLAIEVDITSSSVNRMAIYAVLGVREVWRFDGQALTFHLLGASTHYGEVSHSQALPLLSAADVLRFVNLRGQLDEIALVRQFRAWLRQQIAATNPPTP